MADHLSHIRSLAAGQAAHDASLRAGLAELSSRIVDMVGSADIAACSRTTSLEEYGDHERTYGYLTFGRGEISVAYRSSEDDLAMAYEEDLSDPTYSVKPLLDCSAQWLMAVSEPAIVDSLLTRIVDILRGRSEHAARNLQHLGQALMVPVHDAALAFEDAARTLGYEDVITAWSRAQTAIFVDPQDAITRASSVVETVCKHILQSREELLPGDQSIKPLMKATMKVLDLGPDAQATADMKQMTQGVATVVGGLGALRTHLGTAHGHGPDSHASTVSEARLAVNLAGAAATFLMEAARAHPPAAEQPEPS